MAAVRDLGELLVWGVAFALASLAVLIAKAVAAPFDLSIPGLGKPFHFVAEGIEVALIDPLNAVVKASAAGVAQALNDLIDLLGIAFGLTVLLGLGVKAALSYLWNHALRPLIHLLLDPVADVADSALSKAVALTSTVAHNLTEAKDYAETQATRAFDDAKAWARTEIDAAKAAAVEYADDAVATLRAAEDAAIDGAVRLATEAKTAGEAAAARALSTAEAEILAAESQATALARQATAEAEAVSARAIAEVDAAFRTALADVQGIAVGAEHGITDLQKYIDSLGLAGLIAAVPALALLVNTIAKESGLDSSACRAKNKQICGTDPKAWEHLISGLAFLTIAFDFKEFVDVSTKLADAVGGLIGELETPFLGKLDPLPLAA